MYVVIAVMQVCRPKGIQYGCKYVTSPKIYFGVAMLLLLLMLLSRLYYSVSNFLEIYMNEHNFLQQNKNIANKLQLLW